MAIISLFQGKRYIEPTVQAVIVSGTKNPTVTQYGRTLVINTGQTPGYGGGKGTIPLVKTPASFVGNIDLTAGHNFGTSTSETFSIALNGATPVIITLTANCTTLAQVISAINAAFITANVLGVYAYNAGNGFVGIRTTLTGTSQTITLAVGAVNDALASLGISVYASGYSIGTSVAGESRLKQDFMYEFFDSAAEKASKDFVKGGLFYDLIYNLFHPEPTTLGIKELCYAESKESAPALHTFNFIGGTRLTQKTLDEGLNANGDITTVTGKLTKGYGMKLIAGKTDIAKYIIQYYVGTYRGADSNGYLYSQQTVTDAAESPTLLFESDEFSNISEFLIWANGSEYYKSYFEVDSTNTDLTGILASGDITKYAGVNPFLGATENFSSAALTALLSEIKEYDYTFLLPLEYEDNAAGSNNLALLSYILNDRIGSKPTLHVGGQNVKENRGSRISTDSTTSVGAAKLLASQFATVYHGGIFQTDKVTPSIQVPKPSLYFAAKAVGYRAGQNPQDTLTYKTLGITKVQDILNNRTDRENLIQFGVCILREVDGLGLVVDDDINTLQGDKNKNYMNPDGSSYKNMSVQIKEYLIKSLINKFRKEFIGTTSVKYPTSLLKTNLATFLSDMVASGLIVSWRNIVITKLAIDTYVEFEYQEPVENNKLFILAYATI